MNSRSKNRIGRNGVLVFATVLFFSHCSVFFDSENSKENDTASADSGSDTDTSSGSSSGSGSGDGTSGAIDFVECPNALGPSDNFDATTISNEWKILLIPDNVETSKSMPAQKNGNLEFNLVLVEEKLATGYRSNQRYNVFDKSVVVEIVDVPNQSNERINSELLLLSNVFDVYLRMYVKRGELVFSFTRGELSISLKKSKFDIIQHAFWRVSFRGNSAKAETSPDGMSWTVFFEHPLVPEEISYYEETEIRLRAIVWPDEGISGGKEAPGTLKFGSINMCPLI